jgi:anti-sigma factor RsiW
MQIKNTNCNSGAAMVGYIYGELNAADRVVFEDHLLDCTACTDEFASVAESRYAVYEWQKLEFEPLETPRFVIPYAEPSVSWLDAIKGMFATGPRLATAGAFGLLIVAVGFAAIFISSGTTDVVSTPDIQVIDTFPESVAKSDESLPETVPGSVEPEERVSPVVAVADTAPKVEKRPKPLNLRRTARRPQNIRNETQAKAPRLNDFEDLSDDSLRLADLVADIDTKE